MGLLSVWLFVLFKDLFESKCSGEKLVRVISFLSKYSFGVYLVHAAFIDLLDNVFNVTCQAFNTAFSVPVLTFGVFVVSLGAVYIIGKIPVLNKYIM